MKRKQNVVTTDDPQLPAPEKIGAILSLLGQRLESEPTPTLRHAEQETMPEWRGADVRITSDFVWKPRDEMDGHDMLVRTRHANVLTWLFFELRDAFRGWIDFSNKYGFYASLAEAALDHLATHQPEPDNPQPLLRCVLGRANDWAAVLRRHECLPVEGTIVVHEQDAEGRQRRTVLATGPSNFQESP